MAIVHQEITVYGRVQGVGYRYFCYNKAKLFNIKGSATNKINGTVVVKAEGNEEDIQLYVQELKKGPMMAYVEDIRINTIESPGFYQGFGMY